MINGKRKQRVLKGLNPIFHKLIPGSIEYKALISAVTYIMTNGKCE